MTIISDSNNSGVTFSASKWLKLLLVVTTIALCAAGCTPSIGDGCEANSDCATDHTCDLSQPGGYCTITPCPREGCPGGSVCIRFSEIESWCMQECGLYAYCRESYTCLNNYHDPIDPELIMPAFCNQAEQSSADAQDDTSEL